MDDLTRERYDRPPTWRERTGTAPGPTLEVLQERRRRDLVAAMRDYDPRKAVADEAA